jgi:hypothetical protein
VVGYDIFRPPGGLFFGLIKYKQDRIRPTFLQQTKFTSFQFNTLKNTLTLSSSNLIQNGVKNVLQIIDLRPLGCPVYQYAALVKKIFINNIEMTQFKGPIYAIFDTGTTGCLMDDFIKNDPSVPSLIRKVSVVLESNDGNEIELTAQATRENIFVVSGKKIPWFNNKKDKKSLLQDMFNLKNSYDIYNAPQIVVLGILFFDSKVFTVDIDAGKMHIV